MRARVYKDVVSSLFLGRGIGVPVAMEGALKLKEISYIHAEAYAAGEMKHGPIALITEEVPVVVVATQGHTYEKVVSNIQEVRARGARGHRRRDPRRRRDRASTPSTCCYVPRTSEAISAIPATVPLQLLAYHIAKYARLQRGPAAQPRQVSDGGVGAWRLMITGLGVDIVEIDRMRAALERRPRMKERLFSDEERAYCDERNRPEIHYALRFAAKEAVLKALGTGFSGMRFTDVEVVRDADGRPVPHCRVVRRSVAEELGVVEMHLSLSFTHTTAVASAVAITEEAPAQAEGRAATRGRAGRVVQGGARDARRHREPTDGRAPSDVRRDGVVDGEGRRRRRSCDTR